MNKNLKIVVTNLECVSISLEINLRLLKYYLLKYLAVVYDTIDFCHFQKYVSHSFTDFRVHRFFFDTGISSNKGI